MSDLISELRAAAATARQSRSTAIAAWGALMDRAADALHVRSALAPTLPPQVCKYVETCGLRELRDRARVGRTR